MIVSKTPLRMSFVGAELTYQHFILKMKEQSYLQQLMHSYM